VAAPRSASASLRAPSAPAPPPQVSVEGDAARSPSQPAAL